MRILMLGNSFTFTNRCPKCSPPSPAGGGLQPGRGAAVRAAEPAPGWAPHPGRAGRGAVGLCGAQEMSHGPITAPKSFFSSVERLCGQIRETGPCRSYSPPGRIRKAGQAGRQGLGLRRDGQSAGRGLPESGVGQPGPAGRCGRPVLQVARSPGALRRRRRPTPVSWAPASRRRPSRT